jgi:hypothetical protein
MLRLAEERFGVRDRSYTILGIEFIEGVPQCWFPGNCNQVVIQLGMECAREPDRACFQLAHEAIHLLGPSGAHNANILEEGLAAHFQCWYMARHYPPDWPRSGVDWNVFERESYARARSRVEELLDLDAQSVARVRDREPTLSRVTSEMLTDCCSGLSVEAARFLTRRFER